MEGEKLGIHAEKGLNEVKWQKFSGKAPGLTWYQVTKNEPSHIKKKKEDLKYFR